MLPVVFSLDQSISIAQNTKACECTDYVANRFGIKNYPDGGDWDNGYLAQNGFYKIDYPQPGAVVVMERSFPGSDAQHGHVGVIEAVHDTPPNGSLKIDVRGANQPIGGSFFYENNCPNVRVTPFATSVRGRSDISYWMKNQVIENQIYQLELKAIPPSGTKQCFDVDGTKIGILPDANQAKVGSCRPIQEQQFRAINDGNDYYRFELKATPPSGTKQCFDVDGTKIGILPDANKVRVGSCRAIQEQQFKLIQDGDNYVRFELRATPTNGIKQCFDIDGTKIGINQNANLAKVGQCKPIQEQQFRLIKQ
jgi:surface antigen